MNLIAVFTSLTLIAMASLEAVQVTQSLFKATLTTQVKTDVDTYVYNAQTALPAVGDCTTKFCYIHDSVNNGKTYMVFQASVPIYGGQIMQRLKPIPYVPPTAPVTPAPPVTPPVTPPADPQPASVPTPAPSPTPTKGHGGCSEQGQISSGGTCIHGGMDD